MKILDLDSREYLEEDLMEEHDAVELSDHQGDVAGHQCDVELGLEELEPQEKEEEGGEVREEEEVEGGEVREEEVVLRVDCMLQTLALNKAQVVKLDKPQLELG